jgi:hypothetical protein
VYNYVYGQCRKIKVILCPSLSPDIVNIINACLVKDLSKLKP